KFVGAGLVVNDRLLHRIASIAQAFEIDAFDHTAVFHVETGNDADLEHYILPFAMAAMFINTRPVTASAGTPVVRVMASASRSISSASPSLSVDQRDRKS